MCKHNFCWTDCDECHKSKSMNCNASDKLTTISEDTKKFIMFALFVDSYLSSNGMSKAKLIDFLTESENNSTTKEK